MTSRKGANRTADIPASVLDALSRGELQTATLSEIVALDQARLLRTVFPKLSASTLAKADAISQLGILRRMAGMGALLLETFGADGIARCQAHRADTVRGWACFIIGAQPDPDVSDHLAARLAAIEPLADDAHFGVREWAWMALRPHLVHELDAAIALLAPWSASPSERLRRFASEVLRPRGVWCAHIPELKRHPEKALPILEPLRADPSLYVQDSVANWLNDAAKDQANWVRELCGQWLQGNPPQATRRICQRGLRSMKG